MSISKPSQREMTVNKTIEQLEQENKEMREALNHIFDITQEALQGFDRDRKWVSHMHRIIEAIPDFVEE